MRRILDLLIVTSAAITISSPVWADAACEGRRAWLRYNCAGCHGARSTGGMGPNILSEANPSELQEAMQQGEREHGMRSYNNVTIKDAVSPSGLTLNSTQIAIDAQNIATYLQSINSSNANLKDHPILGSSVKIPNTSNEPTFVDWWKKVPTHNMLDAYTPTDIDGKSCSFTSGE